MLNDAWVDVLSFLDVQSIVWASVGLKPLLGDAARDNRLWKWLCQLHWQSKQPHPWSQTSASVECHRIFQQAWQDSRRCAITEEELCRVCWMRQLGASRRQGFFSWRTHRLCRVQPTLHHCPRRGTADLCAQGRGGTASTTPPPRSAHTPAGGSARRGRGLRRL